MKWGSWVVWGWLVWITAACTGEQPPLGEGRAPPFSASLEIVNEDGQPVRGAVVQFGAAFFESDDRGHVELRDLEGPVLAVVQAAGYLNEPVAIGRTDATAGRRRVRLFAHQDGRRFAIHAGGDAIFGRRFLDPLEGRPLIRPSRARQDAQQVVSRIAPAFAAADFSLVNLETVLSEFPEEVAQPGKRFVIQSPPDTATALHALGVDAVVLANNHMRDYRDEGVVSTLDALRLEGLSPVGAGLSAREAEEPLYLEHGDFRIAVSAWTTMDGDGVNDAAPRDEEPVAEEPGALLEPLYEPRMWGFSDDSWEVPAEPRRIGTAWEMFQDVEPDLGAESRAAAWASLIEVYPELQDLAARRGHGGPALWRSSHGRQTLEGIRNKTDLLVVQLHAGLEYTSYPSSSVRDAARDAIDAGADLVLAHHPHTFQGFEWYKGKLIAYSLGNLVFDQNLFVTYRSAFLRTVWEGTELLEARIYPIEIIDYQPTPVTDEAAVRGLAEIAERSLTAARARLNTRARLVEHHVVTRTAHDAPVYARLEGHTARLETEPLDDVATSLAVAAGQALDLPEPRLVRPEGLLEQSDPDIFVGRDLFNWGHFEDTTAGGDPTLVTHFETDGSEVGVVSGDAASGHRFLRLRRSVMNISNVFVRASSRIPLVAHRLYRFTDSPLDPPPRYSVKFKARLRGRGRGPMAVRLDLYHRDEGDPWHLPSSVLLGRQEFPFEVPSTDTWHEVVVDIPEEALAYELSANGVLLYIVMAPTTTWDATLDIDDLAFIEWRQAAAMPEGVTAIRHVRNTGSVDRTVTLTGPALRSAEP